MFLNLNSTNALDVSSHTMLVTTPTLSMTKKNKKKIRTSKKHFSAKNAVVKDAPSMESSSYNINASSVVILQKSNVFQIT